jgi:hypothetical protein
MKAWTKGDRVVQPTYGAARSSKSTSTTRIDFDGTADARSRPDRRAASHQRAGAGQGAAQACNQGEAQEPKEAKS